MVEPREGLTSLSEWPCRNIAEKRHLQYPPVPVATWSEQAPCIGHRKGPAASNCSQIGVVWFILLASVNMRVAAFCTCWKFPHHFQGHLNRWAWMWMWAAWITVVLLYLSSYFHGATVVYACVPHAAYSINMFVKKCTIMFFSKCLGWS